MQKVPAVQKKSKAPPPPLVPEVRGEVVMKALDKVKPNVWNPNELTPFQMESLKQGFREDGWLISQSLVVWGKDDKGKQQNVIIDGEHRWRVATDLGMKEGPMMFLNGLPEAKARALTIKLDAKRGKFNEDRLAAVVREIQFELGVERLDLSLGLEAEHLATLLVEPALELPSPEEREGIVESPPGVVGSGLAEHASSVRLFFNKEQLAEFEALIKELAPQFKTKNSADTTLEALRRVRAAQKSRS